MKTESFLYAALVLIAISASVSFAAGASDNITKKVSTNATKERTTTTTTKPTTTMTTKQRKILKLRRWWFSCYVTCFGSERDISCAENTQTMKCMICRNYLNCFKKRFVGHAVA